MENEIKKNKKYPLFWIIYGCCTLVALLAVGLLLHKLYGFLDAYESTRPVHEADKVVESIFQPENREILKKVLSNKVENGIESIDEVLDIFYASVKGKELTHGRYFGHYTDEKPAYLVSAGKDQVAAFYLKETVKYDKDYNFKLWDVESVNLTLQPKYSYAVTVPETMTLFINGQEIPKTSAAGHKDSDCKVGYAEYSGAGFYAEPQIKVVDRAGQEVVLEKDGETGAYYYLLHYAYAPFDTVVSFNGIALTENEVMEDGIDSGVDFFMIKEVLKKYSEYKTLEEQITYPSFVRYYVDLYVKEEDSTWINRLGTESRAEYVAKDRCFTSELVSDDSQSEELIQFAKEFVETYTLFCSRDKKIKDIKKFFPANSEYYEKISHLNNYWFHSHTDTSFENYEVKEYFGYGEQLVYVHLYMEEKMKLKLNSKWVVYPVDLPVWLVKIEDKWYIGGIDFDNFKLEL